ncbi:MAG: FKBP-type peptidyl-prolyl cis-trans isomerase [Mucilaginibacter sp.]
MKKNIYIAIAITFIVGISFLVWRTHRNKDAKVDYLSQLNIEELRPGLGSQANGTSRVKIHAVEWIMAGGKMIDNTYQRLAPMEFSLKSAEVIQGLKDGIVGMKVGGKRKLIIPPHLAYGDKGFGNIPPRSHLVFEIELLEILPEVAADSKVADSSNKAAPINATPKITSKKATKAPAAPKKKH